MITRREKTVFMVTVAVAIAVILSLCASFGHGKNAGAATLEIKTFRLLNSGIINPALDRIMPLVTDFRRWKFFVIFVWSALVLFGGTRGRWVALVLIVFIVSSDQLTSHLIKPLVSRTRPCDILGRVHLWYGSEGWITTPAHVTQSYKSSFSFPSGHSANITPSMLFLGLVYRRFLVAFLTLAALVALSRIYIGVHWPLDVAAGVSIGAVLGWLAYIIYRMLPWVNQAETTEGISTKEQSR